MELSWIDGIIVLLICLFDEFIIKKLIFKGDEKYKLVYRYAPIVLGAIVYLIMGIVNKTGWIPGLVTGVGIGLGAMGSYDAIIKIFKTQGISSVKEIGEEVAKTVKKEN